MTTSIYLLISDVAAVAIVGGVGLWGMRYFMHAMRDTEFKNLRYIWEPAVISGGFFLVMIVGLLINDVFGTYIDTPYYISIHPFFLVASGFFALSIYRFTNTVKLAVNRRKQAEVSVEQMSKELMERMGTGRPNRSS